MAGPQALCLLALLCASTLLSTAARLGPDQQHTLRPVKRQSIPIDFADGDDDSVRSHWALLIAGSAGWGNYRHQADVLHAHAVLKRGGLRDDHMVVMAYDDLAGSYENPVPGKVINKPGGPDLYAGVRIDYRGDDVNSNTFLAVLGGNKAAVNGVGTGRVIESTRHDRVFLFYSDHGAAGVLGMPSGPFLYADQLMNTLTAMHEARRFKELVLYIEACESGSMFEGLMPDNASIYVTTAANAYESSWATYCPTFGANPDPAMSTCLGDLYSVAWMENSEAADLTHETLLEQYRLVKARASNNFTYVQGSHVMQYGELDIDEEVAGDYIGMGNNGSDPTPAPAPSILPALPATANAELRELWMALAADGLRSSTGSISRSKQQHAYVEAPQRHADLLPLLHAAQQGTDAGKRMRGKAELARVLEARRAVDDAAGASVRAMLLDAQSAPLLLASMQWEVARVYPAAAPTTLAAATQLLAAAAKLRAGTASGNDLLGVWGLLGTPSSAAVRLLVEAPLGRPRKHVALVDSWDCLRGMVQAWESECGRMDQYAMHHTRLFANLCNARLEPSSLALALVRSGNCRTSTVEHLVRPS